MATLWFQTALLSTGWARNVRFRIRDERIAAIETAVPAESTEQRHALALPGLPNLHSHAFQRGMAGLAESGRSTASSFWGWRDVMYRFVDRMTPTDVEAVAAQAYVEMLEGGFTRVGEFHYLHHDRDGAPYRNPGEMAERVAAAAAEARIRLTLLPVFYAHADFGGAAPAPGQRRFVNDRERYGQVLVASEIAVRQLPMGVVGLAPHSLRAVTTDELTWIIGASGDGPIHIHIAEQKREVEACLAWSGLRPVEWLLQNAPVDARWCLVHATHINAEEMTALVGTRAVVGLCPITEANLGDGLFPADAYVQNGGAFGIGSDSNVLIDPAEELRLLEYGQRLTGQSRNVLATEARSSGRTLFDGAVAGGATALGALAGLQVGAAADFVSLDLRSPAFIGRDGDQLLDAWIFAARRPSVHHVWIGGVKVVDGGRHVRRTAVQNRFRKTLARLLQ